MSTVTDENEIDFEIPNWAGKPPPGMHLDVNKGEKLIQKLMIDEKKCYFFGRNPKQCDFIVDHASCSRVHAALVYHKILKRLFLVDLDSSHGTYIGKVRLEGKKPEQLLVDQQIHFGASSRIYTLREKPPGAARDVSLFGDQGDETSGQSGGLLGLPDNEGELDSLTEYNTAMNRRVGSIAMAQNDLLRSGRKRKNINVVFADDDDVINPEDIDPSVGRFRNMVQTAIIPNKRPVDAGEIGLHALATSLTKPTPSHRIGVPHSNPMHPREDADSANLPLPAIAGPAFGSAVSTRLGLSLPSAAPDVDLYAQLPQPANDLMSFQLTAGTPASKAAKFVSVVGAAESEGPQKKKYAKEAWPGKKPAHLLV